MTNRIQQLRNRARQLYKNISMLFLFPVKYGKLSTGVNAQVSFVLIQLLWLQYEIYQHQHQHAVCLQQLLL